MTILPPEFPTEGPGTPSCPLLVLHDPPTLIRLVWGRERF